MKRLLSIISIVSVISIAASCDKRISYSNAYAKEVEKNIKLDSINRELTKAIFDLTDTVDYWKEYAFSRDVLNGQLQDSVDFYREDAFVYKYKIERIKAYNEIVKKNSSQSKYFLGWVRRVLED